MNVPAAARSIDRPPSTEPVKLTKSKLLAAMSCDVRRVVEEDVLEHVFGNARLDKRTHHALPDQDGLARMLDDHGIPRHQCGGDRVDRRHVGIVPGRDDEDDAMGDALDPALETGAVLDNDRRQRVGRNRRHIVGALVEATELAAVADRTSHLPGKLRHDLIDHLVQARNARKHKLDAVLDGPLGPALLRRTRTRNRRRSNSGIHRRALGINLPVHRGNALDHGHEFKLQRLNKRAS